MKVKFKHFLAAFLCTVMVASMALPAAAANSPADDTEKTEVSFWAKEGIELAREAGLITEHTSEYMTRSITRFQFAELIVNMVEKATQTALPSSPNDNLFTDCTEPAVLKAFTAGIVSGVGDNKFAPDEATNRQQIATMIYRAITYIEQYKNQEFTTKNADLSKFADKAEVADWATEGVGILASNGIMKGTSDTTLSPAAACSIEQSILLAHRVFELAKTPLKPSVETTYEKFPTVPDYGAFTGLEPIRVMDEPENAAYGYVYEYDEQQTFDYIDLLGKNGFVWIFNDPESGLSFRNIKHKDSYVQVTPIAGSQVVIAVYYDSAVSPVSPVTYYKEGAKVPDFGSVTGCSLINSRTDDLNTQYAYNFDGSAPILAYMDQLVANGFKFFGNDDTTGLAIWQNADKTCQVHFGEYNEHYVVIIFDL